MKMPQPDPIIAEVRAVRDQYAARFDYDVKVHAPKWEAKVKL